MAKNSQKAKYELMEKPVIIAVSSCKVIDYANTFQLTTSFATFYYLDPEIPELGHHLADHIFDIALRLLKYLKLALGFGVQFVKRHSGFDIKAFSDSDWAKCPVTRRSVAGYCVFVNGCLVSWKSKKQVTLSKYSAKAKYRGINETFLVYILRKQI
nr:ribonuclease H-like domain-containing protein [Tanacetum cinerariifolium]